MDENVIFIKEIKAVSIIKMVLEKKLISTKQYPDRKNVVLEPNVPGPGPLAAASPLAASPPPLAASPTGITTIPLKRLRKGSIRKIDFYINIPNVHPLTGSVSRPQNANANGRRPLSVITERIRTNARRREDSSDSINRAKAATATFVMHQKNKGMEHF